MNEILEKFKEFGVEEDDIKIVLACAGAYYRIRETAEQFEQDYGNNYKDQDFTNEVWTSIDNVCEALGMDINSYIK